MLKLWPEIGTFSTHSTQREGVWRGQSHLWRPDNFFFFICATASADEQCHPAPAPVNWHLHLVGCTAPERWARPMAARRRRHHHHHRCTVVTSRAASFVTSRRCKRAFPVTAGTRNAGGKQTRRIACHFPSPARIAALPGHGPPMRLRPRILTGPCPKAH